MTDRTRERQEQLAQWLCRLIEALRRPGEETWEALVQLLAGKVTAIALDGITLLIKAVGGDRLQLLFEYGVPSEAVEFRTDADTLRKIIAGQLTVDGAVVDGRIYARNDLDELLSVYEVVVRILADSATNAQLQELWMAFDEAWPGSATGDERSLLEGQRFSYGYLIKSIPEDVLAVEVEPYLSINN
ncbi:MAG: hypothetical protein SW833_12090 [Cyanobacteriota bacterium]|nr:hypothetical protein [Cyanobacteriota bacterium]